MILTGDEIRKQWEKGNLTISPFAIDKVRVNSYDLTLDNMLGTYGKPAANGCIRSVDNPIDMRIEEEVHNFIIPPDGFVLFPDILYLGRTVEKVGSDKYVPCINGRSSTGRLGIKIHQTAGWGDLGFCDQWTLEISVVEPVRIYPNVNVAQVIFYDIIGEVKYLYNGKYAQNCLKSRFFKEYWSPAEIKAGKKKGEELGKILGF